MRRFERLFYAAALPLGKTMYVFGGGWDKKDKGAGKEATQLFASSKWENFFMAQDQSYNYRDHLYKIHNGLDCSGYIGFCIYNALECKNGQKGYVTRARDMGDFLSGKGFGRIISKQAVKDYLPGDIMYCDNHVYMVLGACSDGSVLLIHSSPPGVQINGTVCLCGSKQSLASSLAESFMKDNYPYWYAKFPHVIKPREYLEKYNQFRWHSGSNAAFSGVDEVRNKSCRQILQLLSGKNGT